MSNTPTPMYDFLCEIQEEFNGFMTGTHIGSGKHRAVYAMAHAPLTHVIKIERPSDFHEFCNVNEWNVWQLLKGTPAGKWLAPCTAISRQGSIMIMRRTDPIPTNRLPRLVPDFLSDTHAKNWGLFENKPVMHDYGFLNSFLGNLDTKKKFRMVLRSRGPSTP